MKKFKSMYFISLILFLFSPQTIFANAKPNGQFSTDCKTWRSEDEKSEIKSGYIKAGNDYLYFDFAKKLWIQTGETPAVFIKLNDEMNVLVGSNITSYKLKIKTEDTIKDVLWTLAGLGKELMNREQWSLRTKDGRGQITKFFSPSENCSSAATAKFVSCTIDKCLIGPNVKDPGSSAKTCSKELGLLEPSRLAGITNACKVFTDQNNFKLIASSRETLINWPAYMFF